MVCVWVCVGGAEVGVEAGAGAEAEAETESPDSRQNVGSVETVGAVVIVGLVGTVSVVVIFTVHMALPAIILWAPFLRRPETMSVESLSANDTVAMVRTSAAAEAAAAAISEPVGFSAFTDS
mmetsp:Transcript_31705/g.72084  ORF Transcript_31705/g.72084 Transcript_31705/m.72084 type:complete len:122 (-) Transcript_31705:522-887(-)